LGKGHRTDAVGAGQPKPGETLGVGQGGQAFLAPILGSAPFSSRAMFSWWRI
jgi:hypothetical protein